VTHPIFTASIQAIEEEIKNLNAIEKVITVEYKALIADGKYHLNGKMFSYKVLEEGSKQQSYFWVVPGEDRTLDVTSVHGDWWTARKDGMRRGLEAEETEVGGSRVKKTKKGETNAVMDDRFKRLMMKTEEAKIKNQTREEQVCSIPNFFALHPTPWTRRGHRRPCAQESDLRAHPPLFSYPLILCEVSFSHEPDKPRTAVPIPPVCHVSFLALRRAQPPSPSLCL
jgi:hypothetical protein